MTARTPNPARISQAYGDRLDEVKLKTMYTSDLKCDFDNSNITHLIDHECRFGVKLSDLVGVLTSY